MYGLLRSPELPVYGAKTLAVRDGTLDLHGNVYDYHILGPTNCCEFEAKDIWHIVMYNEKCRRKRDI